MPREVWVLESDGEPVTAEVSREDHADVKELHGEALVRYVPERCNQCRGIGGVHKMDCSKRRIDPAKLAADLGGKIFEHVDDFICGRGDRYARWMLHWFRMPANWRIEFAPEYAGKLLFCTYNGERWRVIGASRMGVIWLSPPSRGGDGFPYEHRVVVDECSAWGPAA